MLREYGEGEGEGEGYVDDARGTAEMQTIIGPVT